MTPGSTAIAPGTLRPMEGDVDAGAVRTRRSRRIPMATVTRLPLYQRVLAEALRMGQTTISSEQLAALAGVNAPKVRKDLSHLGTLGTRGSGYDPGLLVSQIDHCLGVDRDWPLAVVGIGNLGRALVNSEGFSTRGFRVAALFDVDPAVVGQVVGGMVVHHVDVLDALGKSDAPGGSDGLETSRTDVDTDPPVPARPEIGVIATPADAAQDVADRLVAAGVGAILDFAPRVLRVPADVVVRYVDLSMELQVMSFFQSRRHAAWGDRPVPALGSVGRAGPPGTS